MVPQINDGEAKADSGTAENVAGPTDLPPATAAVPGVPVVKKSVSRELARDEAEVKKNSSGGPNIVIATTTTNTTAPPATTTAAASNVGSDGSAKKSSEGASRGGSAKLSSVVGTAAAPQPAANAAASGSATGKTPEAAADMKIDTDASKSGKKGNENSVRGFLPYPWLGSKRLTPWF